MIPGHLVSGATVVLSPWVLTCPAHRINRINLLNVRTTDPVRTVHFKAQPNRHALCHSGHTDLLKHSGFSLNFTISAVSQTALPFTFCTRWSPVSQSSPNSIHLGVQTRLPIDTCTDIQFTWHTFSPAKATTHTIKTMATLTYAKGLQLSLAIENYHSRPTITSLNLAGFLWQ